jgi:hypothetical protein
MFPTKIVSAAMPQSAQAHSCLACGSATNRKRPIAANDAAFTPVDMYAVIGVGAPSYTSGLQTWNGAAATLNPSPTSSIASPAAMIGDSCTECPASNQAPM